MNTIVAYTQNNRYGSSIQVGQDKDVGKKRTADRDAILLTGMRDLTPQAIYRTEPRSFNK